MRNGRGGENPPAMEAQDRTQRQKPKNYAPAFEHAIARLLGDTAGAVLCLAPLKATPSPSSFGGGLGWGSIGSETVLNLRENRLRLHQRFAIGKAQHTKTSRGEPLVRDASRALIFVMPAVKLDDQHAFDAAKVDDVRTDRMLAAKLHPQLMPPQMHPEPALGVGLFAAQSPCAVAREWWRAHGRKIRTRKRRSKQASGASSFDPHPNPPPKHGGGSQNGADLRSLPEPALRRFPAQRSAECYSAANNLFRDVSGDKEGPLISAPPCAGRKGTVVLKDPANLRASAAPFPARTRD
jgi:hypothetical protein